MEHKLFGELTPNELVALEAAYSIMVGNILDEDELIVFANFLVSAGITIILFESQRVLLKSQSKNVVPDVQTQIHDLQNEIQQLKQSLLEHK